MSITAFSIKNHQITSVLLFVLFLLGIVSITTMPRTEDPIFDFPTVVVTIVNPGITPVDIEKLIVDPLEENINELEDIKKITTNIDDGLGVITIEFIFGSDADDKYDDVLRAVAEARDILPEGIVKLDVQKRTPSNVAILQLALSSDQHSILEMKQVAERIEKKLERVSGVKKVDIEALDDLGVSIRLNLQKMHGLGLSIDHVMKALISSGKNLPGGHANTGDFRFVIKSSGDFESLTQIANTPVYTDGNTLIYIRDIANVNFDAPTPSYQAEFKGKRSIFINIIQREGTQIFEVLNVVKQNLKVIQSSLPTGMTLEAVIDQSESVSRRINGFFSSLAQGLLLVALTVFVVLGRRASFIVVLAIPVSIVIAIGWLDLAEFGLQQMSIVGLVIALGLLVDNAIVMVESIIQSKEQNPQLRAKEGSRKVTTAIVSGTLTTILSFVPLLMMNSDAGTFLRSMPVTVILTLITSLLVALTLMPLMASKFLKVGLKPTFIQQKLTDFSQNSYHRYLKKILLRPKTSLSLSLFFFIITLTLFPLVGVSLFPKAEKPMIIINIETPETASFYTTKRQAIEIAEEVNKNQLVKAVSVNIGRGNPRIYYNETPNRQTPNFAQLLVLLNESKLAVVEPYVESLRAKFNKIPEARITVKEFNQGPRIEAPISIRVFGDNFENIQEATIIVEKLLRDTAGTVTVYNPMAVKKITQRVDINREKAALAGVTLDYIDRMVRASLVGLDIAKFTDSLGDEYPIRIIAGDFDKPSLEALDRITFSNSQGELIPFRQLADLNFETTYSRFQHYNLKRTAVVTSDVKPGFNVAILTSQVKQLLEERSKPEGVSYGFGGEEESRQESFNSLIKALIIALLGIFSVLVMQFRSFKQPLIIFVSIPFAITGAILALLITGYSFSFTAFVGLTSLIGIVVNNAIIMVDTANQYRANEVPLQTAIVNSACSRLTPILLTTATTIGGLLPLTLSGSSMWSPLGTAIIGGLLLSTLLSLFVVPILYLLITGERKIPAGTFE